MTLRRLNAVTFDEPRGLVTVGAEAPGVGSLLCAAYGGAVGRALRRRRDRRRIHQAWTKLRPHVSGRAYQNYIDLSLPDWQDAYYAQNRARLKATRVQVDPHHYFNFPQAIGR